MEHVSIIVQVKEGQFLPETTNYIQEDEKNGKETIYQAV